MENQQVPLTRFAVCLNNSGNEVSLELGKLYQVLPDDKAVLHGYLRVIDESGEDYWLRTRSHSTPLTQTF